MTLFSCEKCNKVGSNPSDFHKIRLTPQDSPAVLCSNCTIEEQAQYISHIYKVMERIYNKMIVLQSGSGSGEDGGCSVSGFRELT
jgi:hypothetical protein